MPRKGNNPKRRVATPDRLSLEDRRNLAEKLIYIGSALHKRYPGNYGFQPSVNPRPWKSICDGDSAVLKEQAAALLREGTLKGMFSNFENDDLPKFVWSVDANGVAYEAKIGRDGYHGYRLEEEDAMRGHVLKEWVKR